MILVLFIFFIFYLGQCTENCRKSDQYCQCDKICVQFGDCCPGHEKFQQIGSLESISSCKVFAKNSYENMRVINKCVNDNHYYSKYCTKELMDPKLPIKSFAAVMGENKLIYENYYCARCNNIKRYQYFSLSVSCFGHNITNFKQVNEIMIKSPYSCSILPLIDSELQRTCFINLTRLCQEPLSKRFDNVSDMCLNGKLDIVSDGRNFYRNDHCCSCRNISCFKQIPLALDVASSAFSFSLNFAAWENEVRTKPVPQSNLTNKYFTHNVYEIIYKIFDKTTEVFTFLSMVCLFILILLYTTQSMFRNFGGYLTVCLSTCLWLSNFFNLLVFYKDFEKSFACTYIGISQQFFNLGMFVWMAVYSLDLLQTFGFRSTNIGKKKTLKSFCFYCITGFSCVAINVGSAIIVEFTLPNNSTFRPKYGGRYCWFTNIPSGLIWYFIPVCLLLLWNSVTCVIVFYRIIKTSKECRVVQKKESNSTLWLCVRLTTVFGLGYVLQIFAILSEVDILVRILVVFNSLQGCFLMICFFWAKRVRAILTSTFLSLSNNLSKSSKTEKSSRTHTTDINDDTVCTKLELKTNVHNK